MRRSLGSSSPINGGFIRIRLDGRICQLSEPFTHATGWSGATSVPLGDLLDLRDTTVFEQALGRLQSGRRSIEQVTARLRGSEKKGKSLQWLLTLDAEPGQVCAIATERGKTSKPDFPSLLTEVFSVIPDGCAIYDRDDRLIACNAAFRSVFGHRPDIKLEGLTFTEIADLCLKEGVYDMAGPDAAAHRAMRLQAHASGHGVMIQQLASGRVERIEETRLPGGYIVGIHADVTDLHKRVSEAKSREKAKSEFLSVMSHEVRTPLVGLIGMLDFISEAQSPEELISIQNTMREAGNRLMSIVNAILDLERIESGNLQLDKAPFSPSKVTRSIIQSNMLTADRKGLFIKFDPGNAEGDFIGDELRFGQIVENLLSNAVKFTHVGGVKVALSHVAGQGLRLTVTDTGIGMPADFAERMSRPFEQADSRIARKYGGSGLGLTIVSKLTQLFTGSMVCSTTPNKGSTFVVRLPLEAAATPGPECVGKIAGAERSFIGRTALLADDNDINLTVLSAFLTKLGFRIETATNGAQALRLAREQDFDVILLDISMPELDGVEVMRRIRKNSRNAKAPIVAVTANALRQEQDAYITEGFDTCISKPFSRETLASFLSEVLYSQSLNGLSQIPVNGHSVVAIPASRQSLTPERR